MNNFDSYQPDPSGQEPDWWVCILITIVGLGLLGLFLNAIGLD